MCSSQSAFSESPPIFLGKSLDLLLAVWGWLRFRSSLTPVYTCSPKPQLPLEFTVSGLLWAFNPLHLQLQEWFPLFSFARRAPGVPLWFWPCLCLQAALWCLFPAQTGGGESSSLLGLSCSVGLGRGQVGKTQLGCVGSARCDWDLQEIPEVWGE